jgi:hypothetical protein
MSSGSSSATTSSTVSEPEITTETENHDDNVVSYSSPRLKKAKLLLEQLTVVDPDVRLATTASSTTSNATTTTVAPQSLPAVLPDSYWTNGHLQDNDFVTRWARGVKVAEPLTRYDPVVAEKLLFRQPTKWLVRNVQIALPFGLWAASIVSDYLMGRSQNNRQVRARQLQKAISSLGPAIIKGGQALASRPDLLPSEYLVELQKLQDDVPRFSNTLAFQTVEQELGVNFDEVFELVETEPIAAASIGQVYHCRLLSNGDEVALKIQRPKCEEIIALDLYILRWVSPLVFCVHIARSSRLQCSHRGLVVISIFMS